MIVGPHSTKLPQSWDTESDQLGVPASMASQFESSNGNQAKPSHKPGTLSSISWRADLPEVSDNY